MRTILKIGVLLLLTGCSVFGPKHPEYVLDDAKAAQAIEDLGVNDQFFKGRVELLLAAFVEIETRIREIEKRLKIPSPPLPEKQETEKK